MKERLLFWIPRVLSILAILFMMMFSLDCFDEYTSFDKQLICLLMHNIPAFTFLIIYLIAWKWELIGGILICLATIIGSVFFKVFEGNSGALILLMPFLLIGILFIIHASIYSTERVKEKSI